MALLNPPDVTPEATRLMVESVIALGGQARTAEVIQYAAPGRVGGEGALTASRSMRAAIMLGLLDEDGEQVLVDPVVAQMADEDGSLRSQFASVLRAKVAAHETLAQSIELNLAGEEERTTGVRDLVYGLTWLLAQDALGEPLTWLPKHGTRSVQELQGEQLGQNRDVWPAMNDTRWPPLYRWAHAMGLVVRAPAAKSESGKPGQAKGTGQVLPDPTVAFRESVRDLATSDRHSLTLIELLQSLGEAMPYIAGGPLRAEFSDLLGLDLDVDVAAGGVDSSAALALVRLRSERVIQLEDRADAEVRRVLDPSGTPIGVSHVVIAGRGR